MRFEYQNIKVTNIGLDSLEELGIKIVYASDFQFDYGSEKIDSRAYKKSIDLINSQNPDIILLGGDYSNYNSMVDQSTEYLKKLSAPLGIYGVFGNHDPATSQYIKEELKGSVTFLENNQVTIPLPESDKKIVISGVMDFWTGNSKILTVSDKNHNDQDIHILLSHQPDFFEVMTDEERAMFDITLSGHTHGGIVTIFGQMGIPPIMKNVSEYGDKYRYGDKDYYNSRIYVSSGLGGFGFLRLRFFARPEIVVIM